MKMISAFARVLMVAVSLAASVAQADLLFDTTGFVSLGDPTQLGRLSRNGVPQDWAQSELFPGVINTGTTYHYTTYFVNVGLTPFIQIDFDSISANTFVMAYKVSYDPTSKSTNWVGDEGFSGNAFGTDPNFFNVVADLNSILCIVVMNTAANGGGTGDPFRLLVEGFLDRDFTSTAAVVPEPSTLLLCFLPLMALLSRGAWKRRGERSL